MTTWKLLITEAMKQRRDSWENIEYCTLTADELEERFDSGYGCSDGKPFTLWTKDFVYFPVVYDGSEWADSVPRNPRDDPTYHVGGQ